MTQIWRPTGLGHAMFLSLMEKIGSAWEAQLKRDGYIDFEDMLNLATDCVERGQWKCPYELVMVDEFQDASQARARLVAGLVKAPDKYLFAVGDDWQSINRIAGADLAVMTDFEKRFGQSVTLKLETTFRYPQSLCVLLMGRVLAPLGVRENRIKISLEAQEGITRNGAPA